MDNRYDEKLEETIEFLLKMFQGHPDASFVEVEGWLQDNEFFVPFNPNDLTEKYSMDKGKSHLMIWSTNNRLLIDSILNLMESGKITLKPCDPLAYAMDGTTLPYPNPPAKALRENYEPKEDEIYWIPMIINLK